MRRDAAIPLQVNGLRAGVRLVRIRAFEKPGSPNAGPLLWVRFFFSGAMNVAHERLTGLDRERVLGAVLPVLSAHGVDAVELVWRTDRGGWVFEVTLERPGSRIPGEGITLDLCSEISRDLSAALDVADVIPHSYRLEVGSPGVDRALYGASDYERFAEQPARLKLRHPYAGQGVVRGILKGLDETGRVRIELASGEVAAIELSEIESARLVFVPAGGSLHGRAAPRRGASGRGPKAGRPQGTNR